MLLQLGPPDVLIWGAHNITYVTQDCPSTSSRALTTEAVSAISFVSVCPRVSTRLHLDGYS